METEEQKKRQEDQSSGIKENKMPFKNKKRKNKKINSKKLQVNCINQTIKDRKPDLKLMSNHFPDPVKRIWNQGIAIRNGKGWYKSK